MDYRRNSLRSPGNRPQSRFNPITGEEITYGESQGGYSARSPVEYAGPPAKHVPKITTVNLGFTTSAKCPTKRPSGVPALNLGTDQDDVEYEKPNQYDLKLDTPNTASTVSWGTPHSSYNKPSSRAKNMVSTRMQKSNRDGGILPGMAGGDTHRHPPKKRTAWDGPAVPENLPPPSDRHKQQYTSIQQDMRDSYSKQAAFHAREAEIAARIGDLKLDLTKRFDGEMEEDDMKSRLQQDMTAKPYSKAQELKLTDLEELEEEKKKNKLIETVMIDQLSRAVMSHPEQDLVYSQRKETYRPGMKRGTIRNLHHSKVNTSTSATENLLSKRVRFGARILTRHGRDAIRELTGFFFALDKSLTVYEYRRFGKGHKAMPFLNRNVYKFLAGPRKDEPFSLTDIYEGATLKFATRGQPLPDSVASHPVVTVRITDVDEHMRYDILLENIPSVQRSEVWTLMQLPPTEEEQKSSAALKRVQRIVKSQIKNRAVKTISGLLRYLHQQDINRDGYINKYELEKALIEYHIDVDDQDFDEVWEALDVDGSSFLDYSEFLRGFVGEMTENRKTAVRKAFLKLDYGRQGRVAIEDMKKFYRAKKHPKVQSGECSEDEVLQSFMAVFHDTAEQGFVSYSEFELYYEGLSLGIEDDQAFINIVKNAWGV